MAQKWSKSITELKTVVVAAVAAAAAAAATTTTGFAYVYVSYQIFLKINSEILLFYIKFIICSFEIKILLFQQQQIPTTPSSTK